MLCWLTTARVSGWESHGPSTLLLVLAGVAESSFASLFSLGGAGVDALLGLVIWFKPTRRTYLAALVVMLLMTSIATILAPDLWPNPLGPLTKNVPIAAVLFVLARKPS